METRTLNIKKLLFLFFLFYSISLFADSSIETTLHFKRIGNIAISPDGQQIAYTTSQIISVPEGKRRDYFLFLKDPSGKTILLEKNKSISIPTWSKDGMFLAYLIKNDKTQEIKIVNLKTHQPQTILSWKERNISAFKWSPNEKYIAFVASDEKKKNHFLTAIDVDKDYQNDRIYLLEINAKKPPIPITSNQISINQNFLPTIDGGFDWSPDSQTIAFAYQPRAGAGFSLDNKIALLKLTTHTIKNIPDDKDHFVNEPIFSPDGKWLAYRADLKPFNPKMHIDTGTMYSSHICVMQIENSTTHCLPNTLNEHPFIIGWSATNQSLYVFDWYKTAGPQIYEIHLDETVPVKLISTMKDGFIEPLTLSLNATQTYFGFGYETPNQAPEIYRVPVQSFVLEKITQLNNDALTSLGNAEVVRWKSKDNTEIEGILITPANFDAKKKYPLVVDIHGGPAGAWAKRYIGGCDEYGDMMIPACPKTLLDLGFVIFQPNYRGSGGYGKSFVTANVGDLDGGDYDDIMTGVDYLIQRGTVDPEHLALFGWSYGGYMTAWTVTQSKRFRAAVEGSGLTDFVSFTNTTDIPYYLEYYLRAALWNDDKLYLQRSPIFFSKNVVTPLLILHGKEDERVPTSQSYEFYHALKSQHKPVKMLVFPEQEHVLTDGNIIYESLVATDEWLKKAL